MAVEWIRNRPVQKQPDEMKRSETGEDIRDRASLSGEEVIQLNFINDCIPFVFRKYYRSGLRSHIFEVLSSSDLEKETSGEFIDGIRVFPRAKPLKIFRIFRNRFDCVDQVFNEIKKYRILLKFLGPDLIAESNEFIVDYTGTGTNQILLCGLQEYIEGEILDPWRIFSKTYLDDLLRGAEPETDRRRHIVAKAESQITTFVKRTRAMIADTGYIPDLAGIGNLVLTCKGSLKLVDINNIVKVNKDGDISIDDKGYPSCDVSVQVLAMLEKKILKKKFIMDDPLYRFFLRPDRKKRVRALEKQFYAKKSFLIR
jgi:hypothetical protein